MSRPATLPLGIDVGTTRTRVALLERDERGVPRLVAVASRATGDDPATAIADARAELRSRERRCVLALGPGDAVVRTAAFPAMGRAERDRAARFEAMRHVAYPIAEAAVRVAPLDERRCVVAIARRERLAQRVNAAKRAGLRAVAVDDMAFALLRAVPSADAILDVGERQSVLVVRGGAVPAVRVFRIGGRAFTDAVRVALGVDAIAAERRKCGVGLAGAGEAARDDLVERVAAALIEHRASSGPDVATLALCGNGARLGGLAEALERVAALPVRVATFPPGVSSALPSDVLRAAAPDWALAYGLALWESAA
ncbi:MAG TPA: pilus assembly protein PilM [Candidatus Baltobacteraceae bacterium]|nr:pilus assembly protein PilM [Candidatus Baltobacteraceae bacterium]